MENYFWGIDIGGTNIKLGLVTVDGNVLANDHIPTERDKGPQQCVARIAKSCETIADKLNLSFDAIPGFGVGSPGPLSHAKGQLYRLVNLPKFNNFRIRAELSKGLHCPGILDNDVNSHCWGEFLFGSGKEVDDMVHLAMGTGIGGGIICDGRLIRGSDGNAAELGHMIIVSEGRPCNCGQRGCFEAYASADATARRALEGLPQAPDSSLHRHYQENQRLTCKDVFEHAQQGDSYADQIVDGTAQAIALAAINMRHITEPKLLSLGGGMGKSGDFLLNRVQHHYDQMIWTMKPEPLDICMGLLGDNAGVLGAAGMAIHAWQNNLLPPLGQ